MLSEDARNISASLGALAGKIGEAEWDYIKGLRSNLDSLAVQIAEMENKPIIEVHVATMNVTAEKDLFRGGI